MPAIDDACRGLVERVEGALACGVVDVPSGALLGAHDASAGAGALGANAARSVAGLFRGAPLDRVGPLLRPSGPEGGRFGGLQEAHVSSGGLAHFMRSIHSGRAVIVLVTRETANIGMGWVQLRSAISSIEALVP